MVIFAWTQEREKELRVWWKDGTCAAEIGKRFGVTKNAVIGKARRMGLDPRVIANVKRKMHSLPKPASRTRAATAPAPKRIPTTAFAVDQINATTRDIVIPLAERKTIETLEPQHCRFPFGTPGQEDFHFCGRDRVDGLPYCPVHVARCYYVQPTRYRSTIPTALKKTKEVV